ncbi:unnamed protein product [Calicophoron daubneyi]|uniref:valine--tRNA ligase n=1 Tax=Calicophoron daubneyi TaxID=300641 RepID=A0AAV2TWR7_CALDB
MVDIVEVVIEGRSYYFLAGCARKAIFQTGSGRCVRMRHKRIPSILTIWNSCLSRKSGELQAERILNYNKSEVNWKLLDTISGYDPALVEDERLCQKLWNDIQISNADVKLAANPSAPIFTMLLPPPNVTGSLHLGHALTCAVQDALARCYLMKGAAVLWIPGMDHAGIATQAVVERELQRQQHAQDSQSLSNPRLSLGREKFLQEVWKWKARQATTIRDQLNCLGLILNWNREYFTLSPQHSRAVTEAFVRLYEDGIVYRAASLVSWCCYFQSAISDIEVENVELHHATYLRVPGYQEPQLFGVMDYFAYPLVDAPVLRGSKKNEESTVVVATTRLETMLADTALVVHPEDDRYRDLIGRQVEHPFSHRRLPIVADAAVVDRAKGTGVIKLSPGHSQIDWDVAKRHDLPVINMLDDTGHINDVGGEFAGLPRFSARSRLIERLSELGLYRKREDIAASGQVTILPTCSRSGDIIEPLLREQWFVRTADMAARAVKATESGQLRLHPSYQNAIWSEWLAPKNHRDWCISRQLWWGHRIPAYRLRATDSSQTAVANSSEVGCKDVWIVARSVEEAKERARCASADTTDPELEQDPDVLDTWFSSALLPFSVFGWPDKTQDLKHFYPMRLLETGQDILFFWVARMVMLGLQLTDAVPFQDVLLHGLICDATGQKMSKSKGNVVDPLDLVHGIGNIPKSRVGSAIEALGADSLRASLLACPLGQPQVAYNQESAVEMRRFCNKIWQTAKFALIRLKQDQSYCDANIKRPLRESWSELDRKRDEFKLADWWLISRLSDVIRLIHTSWTLDPSSVSPEGLNLHPGANTVSPDFHLGVSQLRLWWTEDLCSVYMEVLKQREKESSNITGVSFEIFLTCMLTGLHLLHPVMPHISEVIWQGLMHHEHEKELKPGASLAQQSFPSPDWTEGLMKAFGVDRLTLSCAKMSALLSVISRVNSWKPLLRRTVHKKDTESFTWGLYINSSTTSPLHLDEKEIVTALTRIPVISDTNSMPADAFALPVCSSSDWFILLNPTLFDLNGTKTELNRRVATEIKRKSQLFDQLSHARSEQQRKLLVQKIDTTNSRIQELESQLHAMDSSDMPGKSSG